PMFAYGGHWKSYTIVDGLAGGDIRAIIKDRKGSLWIATDGDGVSRYDGEGFRSFTEKDGLDAVDDSSHFGRDLAERLVELFHQRRPGDLFLGRRDQVRRLFHVEIDIRCNDRERLTGSVLASCNQIVVLLETV
ncbi:MAG: hypothetical protein IIA75_11715, partial [Proteobacteria bacterium]|nr:hypothetical protein [Pseudomonadota bacterium]